MTWTAPLIERKDLITAGDERTMLDTFLEFHRQTLLWKCSGLTGEQLARRAKPPSTMSLLGLVRHLTDVERAWFRQGANDEDVPALYWSDANRDGDFDDVDPAEAASDFERYHEEVRRCREITSRNDLDRAIVDPHTNTTYAFRWMMLHMIEEYARHNGHADLLREEIDGATGE